MKASDHFDDLNEAHKLIEQCEINAATDVEINFVADISAKVEKYGLKMWMSKKQYDWLIRIAGW